MRWCASLGLTMALLALAGCNKMDAAWNGAEDGEAGGRYAGVGTYPADGLWGHVLGGEAGNDAAAAKLADDGQIIVVVDRATGEVRQCGNRSGFCVAMNPWKSTDGNKVPILPARLDKHRADLEKEDDGTGKPVNAAENGAEPAARQNSR